MEEDEYPVKTFKWRPHIGGVRVTVAVKFKDYGDKVALVSCNQVDMIRRPRDASALQNWARNWLLQPENLKQARTLGEPL